MEYSFFIYTRLSLNDFFNDILIKPKKGKNTLWKRLLKKARGLLRGFLLKKVLHFKPRKSSISNPLWLELINSSPPHPLNIKLIPRFFAFSLTSFSQIQPKLKK